MKRFIYSLLALATAGQMLAVTYTTDVRTELAATPEKAGGIYYAYPSTSDSLPTPPAGYKPVYISHYGRHGSRWVIKEDIYPIVLNELRTQKALGNLTPEGEALIAPVERCHKDSQGHYGELTKLGQSQHAAIAKRMANRFPELFSGKAKVTARASIVPRCIISMDAFLRSLTQINPEIDFDIAATPSEMAIIALDAKAAGKPGTGRKDSESNEELKTSYYIWRDSVTDSRTTASKIFKDADKVENLPEFMRCLYDIAIDVQDVAGVDEDLLSIFDAEDLYNQWLNGNCRMYMENVNPAEGFGPGPMDAIPLLDDIVDRADAALNGNGHNADLRFGHDLPLLRLLALMDGEGCTGGNSDAKWYSEIWRAHDLSPMGANLQLIFMRNDAGETAVAVRLNEQPLPIEGLQMIPGAPGYYKWEDLRRKWKSTTSPVAELVERVAPGASKKFVFEQTQEPGDYFEITTMDGKPAIKGNSPVNIAAGLNWYLKYEAGVHLAWNNMHADLPAVLPLPKSAQRHDTEASRRYYLNYCTHSYSMAFWDRARWQQEIDWMALHGINMPLAITGTDLVWRNTLLRLGYSKEEADAFVAGPAFQAWWLMNNLEGWGGPNSEKWYKDRAALQKDILHAMHRYGMTPVLPGYSGMVPHDADTRLGMEVSGKGLWNGFVRPAFLKTSDPQFDKIADIYYNELTNLCGSAKYYSMDPFHEGGSTDGVDLAEAGSIITKAMKRANPEAVWVIQGWNENPREELLNGIGKGDVVVLDLASEIKPNWGDPDSPSLTKRADGYGEHDWMFCMLLNFGGNVGLHGRMDNVIGGYYKALDSKYGKTLTGIGLTPEGVENNPVMYELMSELMWLPNRVDKHEWLRGYAQARYGKKDSNVDAAWHQLSNTIYNCPWGNMQQGTTESVFCARPSRNVWQVSSWSRMAPYYNPADVIAAAKKFGKAYKKLGENANYRYDLVDITRQAVSEKGRLTYQNMMAALEKGDMKKFEKESELFLSLIKKQDELLSTRADFSTVKWINDARALGHTREEKDMLEQNARLLITTWGPREASEEGGLRDYAHREWHGLLGELYHKRWQTWIDAVIAAGPEAAKSGKEPAIDFYPMDEEWVNTRTLPTLRDESESLSRALSILSTL